MEYRSLGRTGEKLSFIGFGGIVAAKRPQAEANRDVALAVDRGINYFDVAPSYDDAEARLGPALRPFRNKVFLACKTQRRDAAGARTELEQSLRYLETDHFDLYQLHAMTTMADFEQAMGPGGALEAFQKAREQGLVRYLGFSAHSEEVALKLMDAFPFDTVLFPHNWVNYFQAEFGPAVLEKATQLGLGLLALKAMARTVWADGADRSRFAKCWYEPSSDLAEAELALRFTLSLPITAALPPGQPELFWHAVDMAERFKPLTAEEREQLRQQSAGLQPIFTHA